jgi:hypothetical protein
MYILTDVSNIYAPNVIAEASTVADAIAAAAERGKLYIVEEDDMNPDHFDLISWHGTLFTIEPKKDRHYA